MKKTTRKKKLITFIDLFAGIGGIRLGMEEANFKCVFSSEINLHCQETYKNYFKEDCIWGDITKVCVDDIPNHDILCAGFPCQPFSISGKQKGFEDTRGTLFFDICRILEAKNPSVVLLENVKNLKYHDSGKTLATILRHLEELGYHVAWKILNATSFGLPQNRERTIIIGSKKKVFDFNQLKTKPYPPLKNFLEKKNPNFEYIDPSDYTLLEKPTLQRSGLIFTGYRNRKIRTNGVRPNTEHLSRVHKQPNRIYSQEGVHPTLPSQESAGRFFILNGKGVRKLTISECYAIMGFPKKFNRISPLAEQYRQIGNSVAVPMIASIADQLKTQFFKERIK